MFLPKFLTKFFTKKRIVLLSVVCCLLLVVAAKPLFAFSSPTAGGGYLFTFENAVFKTDEMNLQSFVNETLKASVGSIITTVIGCWSCSAEERQRYPGFILTLGGVITGVYANPPASGTQYLAYLGNKLGIVQPAYAQEGTAGWSAMRRIMPVWQAFRDLSYGFFVIIFIFIGFAIMFRVKISPQAVITIESALPKLIIALLLVTFSYAIVGFMIDIMYVAIALVNNIYRNILLGLEGTLGDAIRFVYAAMVGLSMNIFGAASEIIATFLVDLVFFLFVPLLGLFLLFLMGPTGWFFAIIIMILVLIALLRSLWTIIKAWAMVIINLIFAPFIIMVGALPGSNAIGGWFRNLIANLAVLPTAAAMYFLASYLMLMGMEAFADPLMIISFLSGLIPVLGIALQPILGTIAITQIVVQPGGIWELLSMAMLPLTGLGILLMIPNVSNMIQSFISGKPFAWGAALGQVATPLMYPVGIARAGVEKAVSERVGEVTAGRVGGMVGRAREAMRVRRIRRRQEPETPFDSTGSDEGVTTA